MAIVRRKAHSADTTLRNLAIGFAAGVIGGLVIACFTTILWVKIAVLVLQ